MIKTVLVPEITREMMPAVVSFVYFNLGDYVEEGAVLLDIETDKVTLEVCAPASGVIIDMSIKTGEPLMPEQVLLAIEPSRG